MTHRRDPGHAMHLARYINKTVHEMDYKRFIRDDLLELYAAAEMLARAAHAAKLYIAGELQFREARKPTPPA